MARLVARVPVFCSSLLPKDSDAAGVPVGLESDAREACPRRVSSAVHQLFSQVKMSITMLQREKIEELLKLPAEERRRVLRLLQESLPQEGEAVATSTIGDQTSPAAKWLLSMAGRYSGGPGNTAARADEILRAEVDKHRGLTTN